MARAKKLDEKEFQRQIERVLAKHRAAPVAPYSIELMAATREFQKRHVLAALETHLLAGRWNMAAAARALGVSRVWIYRFVRELDGLDRTVRKVRQEFPRAKGRAAVVANPLRSEIRNPPYDRERTSRRRGGIT